MFCFFLCYAPLFSPFIEASSSQSRDVYENYVNTGGEEEQEENCVYFYVCL